MPVYRLTIGISDHVAGPDLAALLARVNAFDPNLHLDVRIDLSEPLIDAFQKGKFDAVIVRRERHRRGGETLFEDSFGWFAAPAFQHQAGEKLRLAMLAAPCGVRAQAIRVLDKANIGWVEAFTGGGVTAIAAAIASGLAAAPLGRVGLPHPAQWISAPHYHCRVSATRWSCCIRAYRTGMLSGALRTLAATFRGVASKISAR